MKGDESDLMIPDEFITSKIFMIRGKREILDEDLAELYNVTTGNLNKADKRNYTRFPDDFMFQLNSVRLNPTDFQLLII